MANMAIIISNWLENRFDFWQVILVWGFNEFASIAAGQ